ncbi:LodA/GoxA family CTQ-dependent oxidase [Chondromyces crocatus]|uniref:Catalase n=1 Tax=Chondromyces crocatus TaxID=52 RepID=A0A0K1EMH7_CHOCO|nr:LodA/GoxA family CTQ-dependent oxidase [Chondromyces crocatus]AKT42100.1 uncharacterized protein CMC5_063240 [Chondromyces crocatus]
MKPPTAKPTQASDAPELPAPPCGCDENAVEALVDLFVRYAQGRTVVAGRDPATRPVFLRLHGVAHGTLRIREDLPPELRVGIFAQKSEYEVWVRFSSDVQPGVPDVGGTVGIALKVFDVEGKKILEGEESATTHDFILQNHDVFFVDTAKDMCAFTCQSLNGKLDEYLARHPRTKEVLDAMEKLVPSVLLSPYWSVLPFKFGEGAFVKYKLTPEKAPPGSGDPPDVDDPFYLRADLHARMKQGEARFQLLIQRQTSEQEMPTDEATRPWSEEKSPPVHVATLILPQQDLGTRGQATYGENLAFNTWHALPEHAPVGSLALARKAVYQASARVRRNVNGVPVGEPVEPRALSWCAGLEGAEQEGKKTKSKSACPGGDYPPAKDTKIVRAAIHPAIGVARVGNSASGIFYGPEVTTPPGEGPLEHRDDEGALKRQAARFRIYGYNAAGELIRELTADWADITWTVHVANRKASWYRWQLSLDIPEAASVALPLRNASVEGPARDVLTIDGGARSIRGKEQRGEATQFRGKFQEEEVYLGELRTDEAGRLVFLGGHGKSASPEGKPIYIPSDEDSFINADGWYDDTSDGPVTAEVRIEGQRIPVEPAWVVTAPPNYAPTVTAVRTLYDLMFDLYVQNEWLRLPAQVSFQRDVYPILQRLTEHQWVNQGFATQFGWGGANHFEDPEYVQKLAAKPAEGEYDIYGELRRQVLQAFRDPGQANGDQLPWPWLYGDAMEVPAGESPRQNAAVSPTQYRVLELWAAGDFVADWDPQRELPREIEQVPLAEQPAMLDRAALDACLADAFHPGCELTWPMRHLSMYSAPFRIRQRPSGEPEPDHGATLTQAVVLSSAGPLHAQGPGDLTRWMGLPWQADTAYCRSGYDPDYDPFVPSFWPARVPNHVLTPAAYEKVMNPRLPREERLAAFARRASWVAPLKGTTVEQMEQMVEVFGGMGLVELRRGVEGDRDFPPVMGVASFGKGVEPPTPGVLPMAEPLGVPGGRRLPREVLRRRAVQEAGWGSEEALRHAPLPVRLPKKT